VTSFLWKAAILSLDNLLSKYYIAVPNMGNNMWSI